MELEQREIDIFLIQPVREITDAEREEIDRYVQNLEKQGLSVYLPIRDTSQNDPIGLKICTANKAALQKAREVHVWWNSKSQGSIFDLGMSFALGKKVRLANPHEVEATNGKSFNNVLIALDKI